MEILSLNDFRYNLLPSLYTKYNWNNLVCQEDYRVVYYYIPPELVDKDYYFSRGWCLLRNPKSDWDNWFSSKSIGRRLKLINLTPQQYFDILILHINDTDLRPKCSNCGAELNFSNRIWWGYNQTYPWDTCVHHFCSKSCSAYYQSTHRDEFDGEHEHLEKFINARYNYLNKTKIDLHSWLSMGNPSDECVIYLAKVMGSEDLKFGVTKSLSNRLNCFGQVLYDEIILFNGTRTEVGYVEAWTKLHNNGSEYFQIKDKNKIISIINKYAKRPIANPFD